MKTKQLQKEWQEIELGDIFIFQSKSGRKAGEGSGNGNYKFFTSSSEQSKFIDSYDFEEEHLIFSAGGQAGIHYCNEKFSASNDCFVVKVSDIISTRYVYYYLKSRMYLLEGGFKGAGLKHLSKNYLQRIKIKYPANKATQKQIVSILEKAESLKQKRKDADKLIKEYLQSVFYEMFGDTLNNPKKWNKIKLGDLCIIRRGASPRPIDKFLGGTIPWIKIGDGTKGNEIYLEETKKKVTMEGASRSVLLKKGSLIFANCGVSLGFARVLKIDGCIHDGWLSLEEINLALNKIYLLKLINNISDYFRNSAPDGTQPNLNISIMKNFEIPLPPIELQEKFASIVEKVEKIKESQKKSKQEINNLFNALMQKAFKGELVR